MDSLDYVYKEDLPCEPTFPETKRINDKFPLKIIDPELEGLGV